MTTDDHTHPNPEHLAEARVSKRKVRKQLEDHISRHVADELILQDESIETSLFADLPWRDPSPSGEFEAIQA